MSIKLNEIYILENEPNKKGDLFGRLMKDLFHSLGYDEPRLNVHKSGREIDLQTNHRTEKKIAIAECKATKKPIGGGDINKFAGALEVEKTKLKSKELKIKSEGVGYFISLSGFTETAIEQELETGNNRIILLNASGIVEELVNGKVLISIEEAIHNVKSLSTDLKLCKKVDLIAYQKGWVWVIYYSKNGQTPSHFSLVHAEGKPLVKKLAEEVISLDKTLKNKFDKLDSIIIPNTHESESDDEEIAKLKYFEYLKSELGEIHFEGLPADQNSGSVKVNLEKIFVPLHFTPEETENTRISNSVSSDRNGIGDILKDGTKIALLANPGGGKSTLIKRIAIAYAFPERRKMINDSLPEENWFPIFIRCRELGNKVTLSISEIINEIPIRAEISNHQNGFKRIISKVLQNGSALLLIDGLDEISDDQNRIALVNQLRTFLATYPSVNIILTSRQAGFRVIGGALAQYCNHFHVSNLSDEDIEELSIKWHKEIINASESTVKDAKDLSDQIVKDNRIRNIAGNPLLLTTLLFVKRWVGYLPSKKNVLYQEMIKLLLVTWNVEGHKQLDIEEAEPQLSYVAYWMSSKGVQTITEEDLKKCLIQARKEMPEILSYTNISPQEFIKRVESRSSLLIMSGHKQLPNGLVTQVYEFLHLSFQEYLTAKAIVEGFMPRTLSEKDIVSRLKPHITNDEWREIIPMVGVLLGRDAKNLVSFLISESKKEAKEKGSVAKTVAPLSLGNCIASEVQIERKLLEEAIEWYLKNFYKAQQVDLEVILNSKYGKIFRQTNLKIFFSSKVNYGITGNGTVLGQSYLLDMKDRSISIKVDKILLDINSSDIQKKCTAYLGLMNSSFENRNIVHKASLNKKFGKIIKSIKRDLKTEDKYLQFSISWAINWLTDIYKINFSDRQELVNVFLNLWIKCDNEKTDNELSRMFSWSLSKLLNPKIKISSNNEILEFIEKKQKVADKESNSELALIYLRKIIFDDLEYKEIKDFYLKEMRIKSQKTKDIFNDFFKSELRLLEKEQKENAVVKKEIQLKTRN